MGFPITNILLCSICSFIEGDNSTCDIHIFLNLSITYRFLYYLLYFILAEEITRIKELLMTKYGPARCGLRLIQRSRNIPLHSPVHCKLFYTRAVYVLLTARHSLLTARLNCAAFPLKYKSTAVRGHSPLRIQHYIDTKRMKAGKRKSCPVG